ALDERLAVHGEVEPPQRRPRLAQEQHVQGVGPLSFVLCPLSFVFCPLSFVLCPLSFGAWRVRRYSDQGNSQGGDQGTKDRGPRTRDKGQRTEDKGQRTKGHPTTSLSGLEPASAMRMGRPTLDWFCLSGSIPNPLHTVAIRSAWVTGRSVTSLPSGLVLPT